VANYKSAERCVGAVRRRREGVPRMLLIPALTISLFVLVGDKVEAGVSSC
jgi:hypothetical protein